MFFKFMNMNLGSDFCIYLKKSELYKKLQGRGWPTNGPFTNYVMPLRWEGGWENITIVHFVKETI